MTDTVESIPPAQRRRYKLGRTVFTPRSRVAGGVWAWADKQGKMIFLSDEEMKRAQAITPDT